MQQVKQRLSWLKRWAALVMAVWAVLIVAPAYAQQVDQVLVEEITNGSIGSQKVTVDGAGNRYVTGSFSGDVLFGDGANSQQLNGTDDIFVVKYNVLGALVWVQKFESINAGGGLPSATPAGIAADVGSNGLYVVGSFVNSVLIGPFTVQGDSSADGFVARLNLATGVVEWVNQIRGTQPVIIRDVDARGTVAITGRFQGVAEFTAKFNTGKTLLTLTPGGNDMFVAQYDAVGGLSFATQAGGGGAEGHSLRYKSGTIMVVGEFRGTTRFLDQPQPVQLTAVGGTDGFVANYFDNGDLKYVKQIGSAGSESALRVVQAGTYFYVAGAFENTLTIGTTSLTSRGQRDLFLVKYFFIDGTINGVTQIGSNGLDFLSGLATDAKGVGESIYVTGEFQGAQLTVGPGSGLMQLPNSNGGSETAYVVGTNANFVPFFGQTVQGKFDANHLVAELDNTVHLAGGYSGAVTFGSGDPTIAIPAPSSAPLASLAVARFRPNGAPGNRALLYVSPTGSGKVSGIAFDRKDMLAFDPATGKWSLLLDGSDIVLGGTDIDAFEWRSDQTVLMSFDVNTTLPGIGAVTDKDIVRFIPTSLGATTNGVFEMFINGSAVGLDAGDENEDIDGITITPEGHLVISTVGPVNANGGLNANGADLLRVESNRTLSLYLEGADLGLLSPGENVAALSVDADGVHLGMASAFDISGVNSQGQPVTISGDGNDVVTCLPEALGSDVKVSGCSLRFDGGANGLGTLAIHNIAVGRSGMAGTDFSDDEETTAPDNPGGVDGAARIFLPIVTR